MQLPRPPDLNNREVTSLVSNYWGNNRHQSRLMSAVRFKGFEDPRNTFLMFPHRC
jgi:hypothetical protein